MPVDSILVAAGVVLLMFVVFAAALAWGDLQTRQQLAQQADAKRRPF